MLILTMIKTNKNLQKKLSASFLLTLSSCGLFLAANYSQIHADSITQPDATTTSVKSSAVSNMTQNKEASADESKSLSSISSSSAQRQVNSPDTTTTTNSNSATSSSSNNNEDQDKSLTSQEEIASLNHMGEKANVSSLLRSTPVTDVWTIGDSSRPTVMAVDVSSYQSGLTQENFNKLASLGVKTIIVKATEGTGYTNPFAVQQIKRAHNAGMNVSLYQYATYSKTDEAKAEANYLLNWLKQNKINPNILIMSDIESAEVTVSSVGQNMQTFQNTLSNAGYSNQGFYTSQAYKYRQQLTAIDGAKKGWIAQYPYTPAANRLWNSDSGAWQFSPTTTLPGYNGYLDVSYDYTGLFSGAAGKDPFGKTENKSVSPAAPTPSTKPSKPTNVTSPYTLKKSHNRTYAYKNGKKVTGWVTIGQRKYYFRNGDGVMLRNWQTINGRTYFFRNNDGVMLRSWQKMGTKTYYFYKDGKMLRNWQTINGKTYYFYKDGKMLRNWQNINGKRYYFYKDGKLLRDYQIINGKSYQLDKTTGALIK